MRRISEVAHLCDQTGDADGRSRADDRCTSERGSNRSAPMRRTLLTRSHAGFVDRVDAGRRLAQRLLAYRDERPVVLALPRGGVVVGYEVARALNAPLDVVVARKL